MTIPIKTSWILLNNWTVCSLGSWTAISVKY